MFNRGVSIRTKVAINTLIAISASIAFSVIIDNEIKKQSITILDYHNEDLKTARSLQSIRTNFVEIRELMRLTLQEEDDLFLEDTAPLVSAVKREFKLLKNVSELAPLVNKAERSFNTYIDRSRATITNFIGDGPDDQSTHAFTTLNEFLTTHLELFNQLETESDQMYVTHQNHYKRLQAKLNRYSIFMLIRVLVTLSISSIFLVRTISLSLHHAQGVANQIASGNLESAINTHRTDEVGKLLSSIEEMRLELLIVRHQSNANAAILESLNSVILEKSYLSVAKAFRQVANAVATAVYCYDEKDFILLGMNSIDDKNYTLEKLCSPGILTSLRGERGPIIVEPDKYGLAGQADLGFSDLLVHSVSVWPMWFSGIQVGALLMAHPSPLTKAQQKVIEHGLTQLAITVHGAQMENDRERLVASLAKKSNQLLLKSQESEQASAAKSEFIGNMSHELRTPLNAILGFTGILIKSTEEKLTPREFEALKLINDSSINLLGLINSLLDYSKIESRNLILNPTRFDLIQLLHECIDQQKRKAAEKGLPINHLSELTHLEVSADRPRIEVVVLSLLSNAIKFTNKGAVTVSAAVIHGKEGPAVRIDIADTGIGISEKDQKGLFERFTQIDGSINRPAEGIGLGLSMTKQLIELHGGQLDVNSVPDEGSVFTVTLPASRLNPSPSP